MWYWHGMGLWGGLMMVVFWGVVIFAAYMGVPTLDHLFALFQLWAAGSGSQALGALFQVAMESAQLVALVLGLKQLVAARTAA